jgi:hypothetical protein
MKNAQDIYSIGTQVFFIQKELRNLIILRRGTIHEIHFINLQKVVMGLKKQKQKQKEAMERLDNIMYRIKTEIFTDENELITTFEDIPQKDTFLCIKDAKEEASKRSKEI